MLAMLERLGALAAVLFGAAPSKPSGPAAGPAVADVRAALREALALFSDAVRGPCRAMLGLSGCGPG
jgi:hypothetical protein